MSETEKAPRAKAEKAPRAEAPASHLIAVQKDGETIHVHPDTLAEHRALGWREA